MTLYIEDGNRFRQHATKANDPKAALHEVLGEATKGTFALVVNDEDDVEYVGLASLDEPDGPPFYSIRFIEKLPLSAFQEDPLVDYTILDVANFDLPETAQEAS